MADGRFYVNGGPFALSRIAEVCGAEPSGKGALADLDFQVQDVNTLKDAGPGDLSFFHNTKYKDDLLNTKAGCVITTADLAAHLPGGCRALISPSPYRSYALAAQLFYPHVELDFQGGQERIAPDATVAASALLEVGVVVRTGAHISEGTFIGANTVIGRGVQIGKNCRIGANVTLSHCIIGDHVTILPGTCIGQAGFGFFMDDKGHVTVPQLGRVILEDRVEVGANVTIDRGALDDTFVGYGSRIDNLVQLGHGVHIGKHCVIVAQVGISGSTRLGNGVIAAGQAGLAGHLTIGDGVQIAAKAGLMRDVEPGEKVAGYPAVPVRQWHRQTVALARLTDSKKTKKDL